MLRMYLALVFSSILFLSILRGSCGVAPNSSPAEGRRPSESPGWSPRACCARCARYAPSLRSRLLCCCAVREKPPHFDSSHERQSRSHFPLSARAGPCSQSPSPPSRSHSKHEILLSAGSPSAPSSAPEKQSHQRFVQERHLIWKFYTECTRLHKDSKIKRCV